MCKKFWVGVDLAKDSFVASVASLEHQPSEWALLPVREFANNGRGILSFLTWLKKRDVNPETLAGVCLEATGRLAWRWAQGVEGRLGPLSIVNPARPVAFAKSLGLRDKTDRIDACMLALYGVALRPAPKPLPTSHQRQLRELASLCERVKRDRIACENRLHEEPESKVVRKWLRQEIRHLIRDLRCLEAEMDKLIDENRTLEQDRTRIQTIPGVAAKTTRILLAQFGDLRQYSRNELVSLAGLYPKQFQSGSSVHRRARLAKGGGRRIRAALYMAALSARRFCPHLKRFADRLEQNGLSNMAILGAVMRKLLLLIRALVVSARNYDSNYADELYSQTA